MLLLAAVAAVLFALTAAPALAQPEQRGCKEFGNAIATFAQQNQGQSVGNPNPPKGGVAESVKEGQADLCD
jgi:hypothetical protein